MIFATALTTQTDPAHAAVELCERIHVQLGDAKADLTLMFASPHFRNALPDLIEDIHVHLGTRKLVGCTGGGIIGVDREVEDKPAVSLWAASLPGVKVTPFRITQNQIEESNGPGFWHSELDVDPKDEPSFILLPDPFSTDALGLVDQLSEAYPGRPIVGGLASGAREPGDNRVWINEQVHEGGAVGVALSGPVRLQTIVSQGCKPIGEPFIITKAQKNVIFELANQPPVAVIQKVLTGLPEREKQLARQALFVGRVINEYLPEFHRGDFLIRNLIGMDPNNGAIAVGDREMRSGQTIQFHIRDNNTADEDLRELLVKQEADLKLHPPAGALLFSCLGRGAGLFGQPHHDIRALREKIGPLPIAGFFCNGEIGPVGDHAFVHGYTSVVGLFSPREAGPRVAD
ncbi:MAG: FIST C-terminal domain-containing protein [Verrucomicrobia bacterium]|nr:FIST C-terminal domain-containing protein [Verrucomicrobiota bacterium]